MIKYRLKCKKCQKIFDSWFSTSKEYEKLKKKNFLNCHFCNSKNIAKTLMAPNILSKKKRNENMIKKNNIVKKKILEFQNFIEKNFENVGDDFVYKARSLHYNNKKYEKGIYGNASKKQIEELQDEGIDTHIFPWIENKNN
tara:strand:- start:6793 stop:7215 length:423 start_codon:yes stop_codon:yes gene_type:complete